MEYSFLFLIVGTMAIGCGVTFYVNKQLNDNAQVRNSLGITGAQAAREMLAYYGIYEVPIKAGGQQQDYFDPRSNAITLSPKSYNATSINALATACHEAGHACQYAQGYTPMKIRGAIIPAANACSNLWVFVLLIGIAMNVIPVIWVAIGLYAAVVLFQLVTLPVEFNASSRALQYMSTIGLPQSDIAKSAGVLRACAMTYVGAALISILQLLYLVGVRSK